MKRIKLLIATSLYAFSIMIFSSCNKILEEQPRSAYTPEFFKTEAGVIGGVTSAYQHLRNIFGQPYFYNTLETGTDEYTYAQSADANFRDFDLSGVGVITPAGSRADALWATAFTNINTCSGVIENATSVPSIPASLIAEARFFRALDYFLLVQTFGGVALDLGSGELKFNQTPSRTSKRNTVPEVYTKAIFPDLVKAVDDLPVNPRVTGGVTKTVARLYLSKAYLTYGWWLENPNNIPTYPAVANRTDPDGKNPAYYFQQAYDVAVAGIANPGPYRLLNTYYEIHVGSNDRNAETMLYADHTQENALYNGSPITGFESELGNGRNTAVWMVTPNYTVLRSAPNSNGTGTAVSSVQREAAQPFGRPYIRMCPTIGAIVNTFSEKVNDSRFDGTFTTVYRANWSRANVPTVVVPNTVLYNANDLPVVSGDPILSFLNYDADGVGLVYPTGASFPGKVSNAVGAGQMPGRADFVIAPSGISRIIFPGLWKMGVYRTDNAGGLGQPNTPSTRPFNIAKFSELYFIAAEAAVKGATIQAGRSARDLINVIRARAGRWSFSNRNNAAYVADNSAAMIAATPAIIDINYILAERSREYFGEGYRWWDLVRTQKWNELAGTYQICAATYGAHTPQTFTRTIQPFHYLRPIPPSQIDGMEATPDEKMAYQNPGY